MAYPLIPLTPAFGNALQLKAEPTRTQYSGGVLKKERRGINPTAAERRIDIAVTNRAEIEAFLVERSGQPFRLSLDGVTDDGLLYLCSDWGWSPEGPGVDQFRGTFKQVRRFL